MAQAPSEKELNASEGLSQAVCWRRFLPNQAGLIVAITLISIFTLATYGVDHGWYCFFLTPTFVLLSPPHLRDWHFRRRAYWNDGVGCCRRSARDAVVVA